MLERGVDRWAEWLAQRRHGGDPEQLQRALQLLAPVRDQVISHADLAPGQAVLDVGCGDGLVAFAAADVVGPLGSVIFSDISADLLDRCQQLARELGVNGRCRFVQAPASDLSALDDNSVDAVTLRSVLIYEPRKSAAFAEFHRVLRPGGRLSLFEPINRFGHPPPAHLLGGYDAGPVTDLAMKVKAVFEARQPPSTDPMLDFDERDLLRWAEESGFAQIHLQLRADVQPTETIPFQTWLGSSGNPRIPTMAEAMQQCLTRDETQRLCARLKPQVEHGDGQQRRAVAYLWATKGDRDY